MQLAAIVVGVDRYAAFKMAVLRFIVLVELERPASRFQCPLRRCSVPGRWLHSVAPPYHRRETGSSPDWRVHLHAVSGCACNQTAKIGVSIEFRMLGRDRHRIYATMRVQFHRAVQHERPFCES